VDHGGAVELVVVDCPGADALLVRAGQIVVGVVGVGKGFHGGAARVKPGLARHAVQGVEEEVTPPQEAIGRRGQKVGLVIAEGGELAEAVGLADLTVELVVLEGGDVEMRVVGLLDLPDVASSVRSRYPLRLR